MKHIYLIGIGGIGMSALARYFHHLGYDVRGYDRVQSRVTEELSQMGIGIHYEENTQWIPKGDVLVIYTPAIPPQHKELVWYREQGYEVKKRAEVLGSISQGKKTIAVAGTHGKTTTTSIITHILRACGVDCTAFLGGIANDLNSNFAFGQSEWVVVEADEYDRSFSHLSPYYAVVTSTDADHLDIYGGHPQMLEGFRGFLENTQPKGKAFLKAGIRLWEEGSEPSRIQTDAYGLEQGRNQAQNIRVENGYFVFDFAGEAARIGGIRFPLAGRHNIENATAAITVALEMGLPPSGIKAGLESFRGIWRRFEFVLRQKGRAYIDDYAHHPTELAAAIGAARELYPMERITGIFQPHLYSRTQDFAEGFAKALDALDEALIMDIYPARELPIPGVTSETILNKMENPRKKRVSREDLLPQLKLLKPNILLTLGAGDIDRLVRPIQDLLSKEWADADSRNTILP